MARIDWWSGTIGCLVLYETTTDIQHSISIEKRIERKECHFLSHFIALLVCSETIALRTFKQTRTLTIDSTGHRVVVTVNNVCGFEEADELPEAYFKRICWDFEMQQGVVIFIAYKLTNCNRQQNEIVEDILYKGVFL